MCVCVCHLCAKECVCCTLHSVSVCVCLSPNGTYGWYRVGFNEHDAHETQFNASLYELDVSSDPHFQFAFSSVERQINSNVFTSSLILYYLLKQCRLRLIGPDRVNAVFQLGKIQSNIYVTLNVNSLVCLLVLNNIYILLFFTL